MIRYFIGLLLSVCTIPLLGAPIGNPASSAILQEGLFIPDTAWSQPRVAYIVDLLGRQWLTGSHVRKISAQGTSSFGSVCWSIQERFDLSVVAGFGAKTIRYSQNGLHYRAHFSPGLMWYGEVKLILFEVQDTAVSSFAEVGGWSVLTGDVFADQQLVDSQARLLMRFWEAGAAISHKWGWFNGYGGVIAMRSRWKMDHIFSGHYLFKQQNPVGLLVGITLSNSSKAAINFEWRGFSENASSIAAEVRF